MSSHVDLPGYVSYSQFTTWLECGWKFYLTRVEKVEEDPAWWFAGGTGVHSASEVIDHHLWKEQQ